MRVSQQMRMEAAVRNLGENQQAIEKLRMQIATGRKILEPEDDPQGTERSINLRTYLGAVRGTLRNLDVSQGWMEASAMALGDFADSLNNMSVRALQAANETLSQDERRAIAVEAREALKQAVDIGNSDERGQYVFAGYRVNQKPWVLNGDLTVDYQGNDGKIQHEIEPGTTLQVNVTGEESFFAQGFAALGALVTALEADDTPGIRQAIDDLKNNADLAMQSEAALGARLRALDDARGRLQEFELHLEGQVDKIEHTDMIEASVELSASEQQYQASLTTLARSPLQSLFDYLS